MLREKPDSELAVGLGGHWERNGSLEGTLSFWTWDEAQAFTGLVAELIVSM